MNNPQAFPVANASNHNGMTLRDFFAGQALIGEVSKNNTTWNNKEALVEECYKVADAMLKHREESSK